MTSLIFFSFSYEFVNKQIQIQLLLLLLLSLLILLFLRLVSKETAEWRRWESETPKFGIKRVDDRGSIFQSQQIKKMTCRATEPFSSERILKLT